MAGTANSSPRPVGRRRNTRPTAQPTLRQFEAYVLKTAKLPGAQRLAEVERIRMLLAMLEWREGTEEWLRTTSYMEVEAGEGNVNEYKERPVLPDPLAVVAGQPVGDSRPPSTARTDSATTSAARGPAQLPTAGKIRTGKVKRWVAEKSYGFITPDDGGLDVFVHISAVVGNQALQREQSVSFEAEPGPRGVQAKNVRSL